MLLVAACLLIYPQHPTPPQAEFLATSNATLDEFLEDNPHQMEWRNMTIADLKHVFSLVSGAAGPESMMQGV